MKNKFTYLYDDINNFSRRGAIIDFASNEFFVPEDFYQALKDLHYLNENLNIILQRQDLDDRLNEFSIYFQNLDIKINLQNILDRKSSQEIEFAELTKHLSSLIDFWRIKVHLK